MGYEMWRKESSFRIRKENFGKALAAVKKLAGKETIKDAGGRHFRWVHTPDFLKAQHIADAFLAWRWKLSFEFGGRDGDVNGLSFEGEKLGDDLKLFKAIARFVEPDSYIHMVGEDSEQWRWVFEGKTCTERRAEVVFPSPAKPSKPVPVKKAKAKRMKKEPPHFVEL